MLRPILIRRIVVADPAALATAAAANRARSIGETVLLVDQAALGGEPS